MIRSKLRYLLISLAVLIADQWSKGWVETELPLHIPREIIPGLLNFTHVQNTGVAFGLFAANGRVTVTAILAIVGLIALGVVLVYFLKTSDEDRLTLVGLSMILGGAVGNLVDRIFAGGVTDFIDFYIDTHHWHTFNIADSAISVGIGLMAIDILRGERSDPALEEAPTEGSSSE